jgi:acetyltransferase-like isoleucine patch superfamily enzyme
MMFGSEDRNDNESMTMVDRAIIGAGTIVTNDVSSDSMVVENPIKIGRSL